jgi:hypothetical protein
VRICTSIGAKPTERNRRATASIAGAVPVAESAVLTWTSCS